GLVRQALVDLQERHHLLAGPQEFGGRRAVDVAVHRGFEQDGPRDAIAPEGRAGDDARAHGVDQVHHLRLARMAAFVHPIELQRLRRAATALIPRRDESRLVADPGGLLLEIAHELSVEEVSYAGSECYGPHPREANHGTMTGQRYGTKIVLYPVPPPET